jgi:hypothetical protein
MALPSGDKLDRDQKKISAKFQLAGKITLMEKITVLGATDLSLIYRF